MDESTTADAVVGIVDATAADAPDVTALATAVERAGGTPVVDDARALATMDLDAGIAAGDRALVEFVRARIDAPVLPVETTPSTRSVPADDADDAIAAVVAREHDTATRRTLAVNAPGIDPVRALADVTLVTSEPARISEYTLRANDRIVGQFRADGVVLATPAGSQGYARAAGSHVVAPHTSVLTAVPIAPFATNADDWVVPDDDVTLTVERDEGDVSLRIDDTHVTRIGHRDVVESTPDDSLTIAVTPQSTGPWPHALEKH
ncbi:ATP-NAD kinase [Halorubellus sp. PRR65]|uniref:ATP-NAD kinase n=1 Tax=Halorubellus sp. PRR65 TaxID=3098148 RepID=UPI002B25EBB6|nr:ATP-NAD kinase [Halorubellus sp. PRR65]